MDNEHEMLFTRTQVATLTLLEVSRLFYESVSGHLKPKTVRRYCDTVNMLLAHFGYDCPIDEIGLPALRAWRNTLRQRDLSEWTVYGWVGDCKYFFNWLVSEGYLAASPAARLERNKPSRTTRIGAPDRNVERMRLVCRSARERAILEIFVCTGARLGGVCALQLLDLDLDNPDPRISRRMLVTEKYDKQRVIFLDKTSQQALREWLVVRPDVDHPFVFTHSHKPHAPLTHSGVYQLIKKLGKRAGLTKKDGAFNPHAFRHRLGRKMAQANVALGNIADVLGHSDVKVTHQFYAALAVDQLQDVFDKFSENSE